MDLKCVLIVDDEEAVLSVLSKSLKKLGAGYKVVTASDGYQAITLLQQQACDLVITDYKMDGMNGLELIEVIHDLQPHARVILMTAYGSDSVEHEARRLEAYNYLTKPLEIEVFRQMVKDALSDIPVNRSGILILSDNRYREIIDLLNRLRAEIGARCIFLTDGDGHFIAQIGEVEKLPLEQIASLVGGSVVTLLEAGRIIDGEGDSINLAYREGKSENLYVVNIGRQLLLIIVIPCGPYNSRLGTVWYYARQAVIALKSKLGENEYVDPQQLFSGDLEKEIDQGMDDLFTEDNPYEVNKPGKNYEQFTAR